MFRCIFVTWRPARCGHDSRVLHLGEAEVADHDLAVLVLALVEQVLRLEVPVDDALAVHVRHGVQDLPDQVGRVLLRVGALLHDAVEQLAAGDPGRIKRTN